MVLETLLVLLVLGAVVATVLSLFVVRSKNINRKRAANPTPTIHSGTTSSFCFVGSTGKDCALICHSGSDYVGLLEFLLELHILPLSS